MTEGLVAPPSIVTKRNILVVSKRPVTHINYNGGKQVDYVYNAVGDLVRMDDWTGTNTFEYDLLSQLKKVTDTKGNVVEYTYDGNGNQTSMTYPDSSVVNYTYDELHRVVYAKENYGNATRTYQYDSLGNLTWETNSNNVTVDYILNNLNQITSSTEDGWNISVAIASTDTNTSIYKKKLTG